MTISRRSILKGAASLGAASGVGMHHHDEPNAVDFALGFTKDNIILQEGMVVCVDMPLLDVGLGGSTHLEDSVLITKDGPEFINEPADRFIMVL